jgi:hypothetical protein
MTRGRFILIVILIAASLSAVAIGTAVQVSYESDWRSVVIKTTSQPPKEFGVPEGTKLILTEEQFEKLKLANICANPANSTDADAAELCGGFKLMGMLRTVGSGTALLGIGVLCVTVVAGWRNKRKTAESIERLNKQYLEGWGHKLEMVRDPNGSTRVAYKQILSDEEIREKEERMVMGIGHALWSDNSGAAKSLLGFLGAVHETGTGKKLEGPRDVAQVWFALLKLQESGNEPRLVKLFDELSAPWIAQLPDPENEHGD